MVERDYFQMLSDEEAERYKFSFCKNCPFYECELIKEYELFSEKHPYPYPDSEGEVMRGSGRDENAIEPIQISFIDEKNEKKVIDYTAEHEAREKYKKKLDECTAVVKSSGKKASLSYNKKEFENGCIMSCRHVYQVECGDKRVTEGIGDHYKIEITEELKNDCLSWKKIIKEGTKDRWEPSQPVFISAPTGQGKNYFIENTLIPYVRELNYNEETSYKILILSNRLALKQQIKNRIYGNDNLDDEENSEEDRIYSYGKVADVMTYQSLLKCEGYLRQICSRYIYVICDEAHFFTSDAMFNPHTHKILETIMELFKKAIRVYMSATPYDTLPYIIECEKNYLPKKKGQKHHSNQNKWKYEKMVFYHFKRDYSYLDVKTYSSISELYDEIVESVAQRKEKWLIFIDDKEKCISVKGKLEKLIEDKECSLIVEDDEAKRKDNEEDEIDENNEVKKKVEKVYAVNANSKKEPIYQNIVRNERLNKDTYVLISTSVLDNGVNLAGIKNIVVSDMEKSKCLQMVGRARKSEDKDGEHKNLYIKRFSNSEVDKRIKNLVKQQDAYYSYELAYDANGNACSPGVYKFFNKYYNGKEDDWKGAKHWFGISYTETKWRLNEIAKSLVEKLIPQYEYILDEMEEELKKGEQKNQQDGNCIGQKYLEYQLAWFEKKYCEDDDITFADKEKTKKEFIDFLESYAESGEQIVDRKKDDPFRQMFTRLYDAAFDRMERDKRRVYGIDLVNKGLKAQNINYKVVRRSSYWIVERYNWEIDDER